MANLEALPIHKVPVHECLSRERTCRFSTESVELPFCSCSGHISPQKKQCRTGHSNGPKKTSTGGWTGVDLFFVLSGFLITGILLDSKNSSRFFYNFYARRILRIFPLYYAALIFALIVLPTFGFGYPDQISRAAPWLWSYCANIGWMLQTPAGVPWPSRGIDLRMFWSSRN